MGRPCRGMSSMLKKGPWTPEEDVLLVTYVHQHGPYNWNAVPSSTGLKRCSKSCRLRWTNYLRPGIKRGCFTPQEDNLIIHLQALLGNKWAAISSYLPERTDNDIKNHWNTHLKKRLKRSSDHSQVGTQKGQWESHLQVDITTAKNALIQALSYDNSTPSPPGSSYACSTGNVARLLKGWTIATTKFGIDLPEMIPECSNLDEDSRYNCSDKVKIQTPLSMIESWLLDDDQAKDCFSFEENPKLLLN